MGKNDGKFMASNLLHYETYQNDIIIDKSMMIYQFLMSCCSNLTEVAQNHAIWRNSWQIPKIMAFTASVTL